MWRISSGWAAIIFVWGLLPLDAGADTVDVSRQYGAGVHDYYRGCYHQAIEHFDLAMGYGSRDPRAYYFRGLAKLRLGWSGDARMDFITGSQLEVSLKRGDVGRALERVQGSDRLLIERYRRDAKLISAQMNQQIVPQPIETIAPPIKTPAPAPATKGGAVLPNLPTDGTDPFREGAPGMLGRGEMKPAKEQPAAKKPATDAAEPRDADDDMDPFAEGSASDEPFGSGVAAEAESDEDLQDPFANEDPAPANKPADNSDPFGDAGAAGAPTRRLRHKTRRPQDAPSQDADASSADDDPFGF